MAKTQTPSEAPRDFTTPEARREWLQSFPAGASTLAEEPQPGSAPRFTKVYAQVTLSQTASWNTELTNTYRTRYATISGRYFTVSTKTLGGLWDVDEITADGGHVDYLGLARTLSDARAIIAAALTR